MFALQLVCNGLEKSVSQNECAYRKHLHEAAQLQIGFAFPHFVEEENKL